MTSSTIPDAPLRETRWVLRQVAGQPLAPGAADVQPPFLLISAAGTAEGEGGCNRFRGGLRPVSNDGELLFAPLAATRVSCPELDAEQGFLRALEATRAYRITGNVLLLYPNMDRTGTPLAQLEAAYLR